LPQPGYVNRHAFLFEYLASHLHKLTRATQARFHRGSTATLVVVDVLLDQRMGAEGKVDVLLSLFQRGHVSIRNVLFVARQFQLAQFVEWRWLKLLLTKPYLSWFALLGSSSVLGY
jgi:hypothetical protein